MRLEDHDRWVIREYARANLDYQMALNQFREMYSVSEVKASDFKRLFKEFVSGRKSIRNMNIGQVHKRASKQKKKGLPYKFSGGAGLNVKAAEDKKKGLEATFTGGAGLNVKAAEDKKKGLPYKFSGSAQKVVENSALRREILDNSNFFETGLDIEDEPDYTMFE